MKQSKALLLLILTAFIWGASFVAQSVSTDFIGPFTFNGLRFIIGALVLLPFILLANRKSKRDKKTTRESIKGGIFCGIALALASMAQQIGIASSTAGKAGFITALYIIIVPLLSVFLHKKIARRIWLCAFMGIVGMYLLCIKSGFQIGSGDGYLLLCAVLFAIHILIIAHFSPSADGILMSMVQFAIAGIICLVGMVAYESVDATALKGAAFSIFYAGAFSCGIAYTLQVVAQKYVEPTLATLALSLESVFSVLSGWIILHETLNAKEALGCIIVFIAVILAELPEKKAQESNT